MAHGRLTDREVKDLMAACADYARLVQLSAERTERGYCLFLRLVEQIKVGERTHRHFLSQPSSRYRFSVGAAVNLFVVKTIHRANPAATARELAGLRADYVTATFLACEEGFLDRLAELERLAYPGWEPGRVRGMLAEIDYAVLAGSTEVVDEATRAAVMWAGSQAMARALDRVDQARSREADLLEARALTRGDAVVVEVGEGERVEAERAVRGATDRGSKK